MRMEYLYIILFLAVEYTIQFLAVLGLIIGIYILTKGYKCSKCGTRTSEVKSTRYEDRTPRKKDGTRDKRYNTTGITWKTIDCKNEKCDNIWEVIG